MKNKNYLQIILQKGEGLQVEFKEKLGKGFDRELVAFANSIGGSIFLGVNDKGRVVGISSSNALKSEIETIARNCDPSIVITIVVHEEGVVEVQVNEGTTKPYQCKGGFFMRIGANSQKMTQNQILELVSHASKVKFDQMICHEFSDTDFSHQRYQQFLKLCNVDTGVDWQDFLLSLGLAEEWDGEFVFKTTAVLLFANDPQRFFPESYITCVRYTTTDRSVIADKKDFKGSLIEQIESAATFLKSHVQIGYVISKEFGARNVEVSEYPFVAFREAIINAVMHRDYMYDASHIYINLYSDRLEIQNPGGLYTGLTVDALGRRSVRRNALIAEVLRVARYVEKLGSGIPRIKNALEENGNSEPVIQATNFFEITFYARDMSFLKARTLTARQQKIVSFARQRKVVTKRDIAELLDLSDDTALREISVLVGLLYLTRKGEGKATHYEMNE